MNVSPELNYGAKPLAGAGDIRWLREIITVLYGIGLVFGIIVGTVLLLVQAVEANAGMTAMLGYSLYGGNMITTFSCPQHFIVHFLIGGAESG